MAAAQGDPADTTVDVAWTDSATASVDSYNVYRNDELCADTTVAELAMVASVDAADDPEFEDTGLTPATDYCYVVTAVDGGDESTLAVGTVADATDNTDEAQTADEIDAPTIDSATLETDAVVTDLVATDDEWELVFNEEMNPATVAGATFDLTDADGDTIRVQCAAAAADDGLTGATCTLGDGDTATVANDTLAITLLEDAEDRNAGGDADFPGTISYPLTITDSSGLTDLDDGAEVDVAGSADTTIG